MKVIKIVFAFTFFLSLLYLTQLFVIYLNQLFFKYELTSFCYILPLIIIITFASLLILTFILNEYLYSIFFISMGIYLGYLFYIFFIGIILLLINKIYSLPLVINILLLYLTPLIICIYGILHALKTKVESITLKYPGFKDEIKILHLSDIHLGAIHQKNSVIRIVQETQQLDPDIVVITGDMADGSLKVKPEWLMPFDDLSMPVLFVTGNHEEMNPKVDMINAIQMTQIKYIGRHETFKFKGVNFIGEDFGYDLRKNLHGMKQEEGVPNVLLSHVPCLDPEELKIFNIFLFLAGHTHGGQVFPFHIPTYLANACFSGLYSDKEKKHFVYVTDGVNNSVIPMRVGSNRVFPIITIKGE